MTVGIVIQYLSKWERIVDLDSFIIYSTKRDWFYYISCWNWITSRRVIFKDCAARGNYKGSDWKLNTKLPDFDLIESSATPLAANPAHKIEFTATDDKEEKCNAIQIWTLKDDKAYLFTYKADPKTIQLTSRLFKVCFSHLK